MHGLKLNFRRPLRAALWACAGLTALSGPAAGFGFPGSSLPGMGLPGLSSPFSGMPGGFPGSSSLFPGMGYGVPGLRDWPDVSGNLPGFSRIFPDFSFNRRDFRPGGPWRRAYGPRRPYRYLPAWLSSRVRPGAGAVIYDMAFVQDRSLRRMRMIVVQTSTRDGMLAQRCIQYSLTPVMTCQAHVGGRVSRSYVMPAPATGPLQGGTSTFGNGMSFSSKGRWRDMTVLGSFRYLPGRSYF